MNAEMSNIHKKSLKIPKG